VAHLDGTTVLADGGHIRAYDSDGTERWAVPTPEIAPEDAEASTSKLVVAGRRLWWVNYDVHELDPANGASRLVAEGVDADQVTVVDDRLIVAGYRQLYARTLPDRLDAG
jgi:hypothetical protein